MGNDNIQLFEDQKIRTAWDEEKEEWYFSVVDVVAVLTESKDPAAYWRKLKQRLKEEGNETVTNCHGLKMTAADGKKRMTDVTTTEQLFRIIQSIPSPKAEPFKLWLEKSESRRRLTRNKQSTVHSKHTRKRDTVMSGFIKGFFLSVSEMPLRMNGRKAESSRVGNMLFLLMR